MSIEDKAAEIAATQGGQIATGVPEVDPNSALGHRMSGHAIHGGYFSVPLITQVDEADVPAPGQLWQGGCINGLSLPEDFDLVISLYPWERYQLGHKTAYREVKMYDDPKQGFEQVEELAEIVAAALTEGKKVLVHCQAGLNRSALVAGTALRQLGVGAGDTIRILRESRGTDEVLCNHAFFSYIAKDRA